MRSVARIQRGTEDFYYGGPNSFAVFAHGMINASILANNMSAAPNGGHIGRVTAIGQILGTIQAADSITEVRSGDQILASISAPNMPPVIEFDSSLATEYPLPALPASVKQDILDAALLVFNELTADKLQIAADIADLIADFATTKATEAAEITQLRADVAAKVAEAITKAQAALLADQTAAATELNTLRELATEMLHNIRQTTAKDKANTISARDAIAQQRDRAYQRALRLRDQAIHLLNSGDAVVGGGVSRSIDRSAHDRARRLEEWSEFVKAMAGNKWLGYRVDLTPPPPPPPIYSVPTSALVSRSREMHAAGLGELHDQRIAEGYDVALSFVGIYDFILRFNPVYNQAVSRWEEEHRVTILGQKMSEDDIGWSKFGRKLDFIGIGLGVVLAQAGDVFRLLAGTADGDGSKGSGLIE